MATLAIEWRGGLAFASVGDGPTCTRAGSNPAVLSPMQTLAYAVMGCMGMDVAHVLEKGRHQLAGMVVRFDGTRADAHPRRYTAISLHFDLTTTAVPAVVERAIELSRTKYCAVWHTLRPDIALTTTFAIHPVDADVGSDPTP
jgi:putative redox protein